MSNPTPVQRISRFLFVVIVLAALSACASGLHLSEGSKTPETGGLFLSSNLGDIKAALITYHDGGEYEKGLEAVDSAAEAFLIEKADKVTKPALVLDIDETSLSNWEQLVANDFAYFDSALCDHLPKGPCGAIAWDALARSPAIAPTLRLAHVAAEHRVTIFFITGRYEAERAVSERNLKSVGFPKWEHLYMRAEGTTTPSAADYKAPVRKEIEASGYTIIVNVGDQPSDLVGGLSERTYLLPNPFYRIK
jgi:predicted secreted acid phosphatase